MKIHALWLSASVLALSWVGAAGAQTSAEAQTPQASGNQVQEVVITAERRSTVLQKTAIAATVLTGDDLIKKGVNTVDQLQFVSPSLVVDNFGQGNDFDIRGIGKGEHNTQTGTGVVTYRDGVATFPGYIQEEPYFDVASIEILRGPQGTFSGQNATGGAVIVNTNNPVIGGGHDGYLLAHYGNYNDTGLQGAVNLPVSDTFAARFAFNAQYRNTFYDISGPWTGDPNVKWGSARLGLLWRPSDSLKVSWKTDYGYLQNGGYFGDSVTNQGTSNLFKFANNWKTFAVDQFVRSILQVDYVNDQGITLRSITGYQQGRTAWQGDIDGAANVTPAAPDYMIDEAVNEKLFSQELDVISPDHQPITWVFGAYYQHNRYDFPPGRFIIGVPHGIVDEDLDGINITHTTAVFGQVSFNLPAGFQLQAGGRYSEWKTWNGVNWEVPEFRLLYVQDQTEAGANLTGKITLNWNLDPHNFLYAFVATGAKPGGLNGALYFGGGAIPPPFHQEYVTDYEVGWKSSMLGNHLHTQLGAYYNNFRHFQVIVPIPNNPLQSTETNNPSPTVLYGLEASAQAVFGDLSLDVGLGLEKSKLGTFYTVDPRVGSRAPCDPNTGPATATCINLAGHPQAYAPELTFNVGGQYDFKLASGDVVTPAVQFAHISDQWGTLFDNRAAGDYLTPRNILNASIAWKHHDIVATLYGTNLLDCHYVSALLPPIRIAGAPRQFGVSIMKTF